MTLKQLVQCNDVLVVDDPEGSVYDVKIVAMHNKNIM
jgi:hypothetical protein